MLIKQMFGFTRTFTTQVPRMNLLARAKIISDSQRDIDRQNIKFYDTLCFVSVPSFFLYSNDLFGTVGFGLSCLAVSKFIGNKHLSFNRQCLQLTKDIIETKSFKNVEIYKDLMLAKTFDISSADPIWGDLYEFHCSEVKYN